MASEHSYRMSRIRSKDTNIEMILRGALWAEKIRGYRVHYNIIGKPDIAFPKYKIAIFCDSEFWHGRGKIPKSNAEYWIKKFNRNIERDEFVTKELELDGWVVLRFSDEEINNSLDGCIRIVKDNINHIKKKK